MEVQSKLIQEFDIQNLFQVTNPLELFDIYVYSYLKDIIKVDIESKISDFRIESLKKINSNIEFIRKDIFAYSVMRICKYLAITKRIPLQKNDCFIFYILNEESDNYIKISDYYGLHAIPFMDDLLYEDRLVNDRTLNISLNHMLSTGLFPIYSNSLSILEDNKINNIILIDYQSDINNRIMFVKANDWWDKYSFTTSDDISEEIRYYNSEYHNVHKLMDIVFYETDNFILKNGKGYKVTVK